MKRGCQPRPAATQLLSGRDDQVFGRVGKFLQSLPLLIPALFVYVAGECRPGGAELGPEAEMLEGCGRILALELKLQLALELAPLGITANAICAGVTDTPALRRIPEGPMLLEHAQKFNPSGRSWGS